MRVFRPRAGSRLEQLRHSEREPEMAKCPARLGLGGVGTAHVVEVDRDNHLRVGRDAAAQRDAAAVEAHRHRLWILLGTQDEHAAQALGLAGDIRIGRRVAQRRSDDPDERRRVRFEYDVHRAERTLPSVVAP